MRTEVSPTMTTAPKPTEQAQQTADGLARLLDRTAPWLADVGTWMFGGLIALNLVVVAALITVGPVAGAVLVAVAAFACALPLEVSGMVLLRVSKDVDDIRLESLTLRSFREAHFDNIQAYFPPRRLRAPLRKRRARIVLGYALLLATLSWVLTVVGIEASLWHMAPWVAELSLFAAILGLLVVLLAAVHAMPPSPKHDE
jgi:hypothetical protein